MISCGLMGGLGNYMFQIAVAESLAHDNRDIAAFNVDTVVSVHKHIDKYKNNIFKNITFLSNLEFINKMQNYELYNEKSFSYSKIPYRNSLILNGYFQSEKYFAHNRSKILNLFTIPDETLLLINNKHGELKNTCSIHVRRGDYIKLCAHHPLCDMMYYNKAMSHFSSDIKFLVFSDDIDWCRQNFTGSKFYFIDNQNDVMDLYLMSLCSNNIIANSSFSWWGAWLNKNTNKKIIAPLKWFGPAKGAIDTKDIIPGNWVTI